MISQMLRPNDVVRFQTPNFVLAPIAGLQMQEPAVMIHDQVLVRCNRAEWEVVERAYVFKDWHSQYYQANPVFLYRAFEEPTPPEEMTAVLDQLAHDAARIVTACRLYKTGPLLEPIYTARFLKAGAFTHRAVGAYRTEYLAMPVDRMTWPLENGEAADLSSLYLSLKTIEQTAGTETLQAAIDQYNLSCTPAIPTFFSIHVLFTVLEMLFDGLPQRLRLKTTRYERAMQTLEWPDGDPLQAPFEEFFRERIHAVRNAVHHHSLRDPALNLQEAKFRLQFPLMLGLRFLMRLHLLEGNAGLADVKQSYGWSDLGPKELMNACLDRRARGDAGPMNGVLSIPVVLADSAATS